MNSAAMKARLEELEAENQRLKAVNNRPVSVKVSEKGALSVYGLGRFPVTLYKGQWEKLIENIGLIEEGLKNPALKIKE